MLSETSMVRRLAGRLAWVSELMPGRLRRAELNHGVMGWKCFPHGPVPVLSNRDYFLRDPRNGHARSFAAMSNTPCVVLVHLSWSHESPRTVAATREALDSFVSALPGSRLHYLANTPAELERLRCAGLPVTWVNSNAFVDEAIFRPLPIAERRWDAVYDARLSPFKRHELAFALRSLGCIEYEVSPGADQEHATHTRDLLAHARWFNEDHTAPGGRRMLSPAEVNAAYNQCRVGLCLSAEEGAMFASFQYLLAGLPVVTTPSVGGRDVLFDPAHVLTVEPSPEAVADGVREMIGRRLDPLAIRRRALELVAPHRARFVHLVAAVSRARPAANWRRPWQAWARLNAPPLWTLGALTAFVNNPQAPAWALRIRGRRPRLRVQPT